VSPGWNVKPPKDDNEYFERMTKSVFSAGLNSRVVDKKWPDLQKAFSGFSLNKVAKLSEKNVKALMNDEGIVRNEKKIRATVHNANEFLKLQKDPGSFREYLESFKKDEDGLLADLQAKFKHLGQSTSRTFLWSVGYQLTPNKEEKKWMASHK